METEIIFCVLGFVMGYLLGRRAKLKLPTEYIENSVATKNMQKLDKLLHNIESYDGTEKNQLQINSEEE